jgi:glutamyl-tRNA synthetase
MSKIRTRFAPSPTGELHIGGARTALFAFLFARHNKGDFLIRIEDTDRERYVDGSVERIIESLKWLGIESDEPLLHQSKRLEKYKTAADELVRSGSAYFCFCTKERLDELRTRQTAQGLPPRYDGKCRDIAPNEARKRIEAGEEHVVRLKVPRDGKSTFNDLVRGEVTFLYREIDDAILLKSDGYPTYHLANVVDDHEMKISHVLRAEEWLSSTPKHLLLYEYFKWDKPEFAHLPMILGQDKSKLSKRHGATSIKDYRKAGYLPEALINFMALLGWNPGDDREIFSLKQLIDKFDLERVGKSPAIFDGEKLDFFNGHYLREKSDQEIVKMILELKPEYKKIKNLSRFVQLEKTRIKKLADFDDLTKVFASQPEYESSLLIFVRSDIKKTKKGLAVAIKALEKLDNDGWRSIHDLNDVLTGVVKKAKLGNGDVFWPVRAALSGLDRSPSPAELLWALGKEESLERLKAGLEKLKEE